MTTAEPGPLAPGVRSTLALNGTLVILTGLLGGLVYVFHILGYIEIFPVVPRIDATMPGTERAWSNVHTGTIMNGLLAIGIAGIGSFVHLGARGQQVLVGAVATTVWGNTAGYFVAAVGGERGLYFGGGAGNIITYFSFLTAAVAVLIAVPLVLAGLLRWRRARSGSATPAAVDS